MKRQDDGGDPDGLGEWRLNGRIVTADIGVDAMIRGEAAEPGRLKWKVERCFPWWNLFAWPLHLKNIFTTWILSRRIRAAGERRRNGKG